MNKMKEEDKKVAAEKTEEQLQTGAENNNEESSTTEKNVAEETQDKAAEADAENSAEKELEELKDKYLRTVAEFENYKRRTLKEKTELILNGGEKIISAILPIIDDMERAIQNNGKTEGKEAVEEGWELIYKKFIATLEAQGVKKIETEGKLFDVDFHEAVAMVPGVPDEQKGKIIDCMQTGYTLNDKVIRHAKVAVGQ